MLQTHLLAKSFSDGAPVLGGISLSVAPGEIVAIVGGSGCGKSTLLRLLCGLERPSAGRVLLDAEAIAGPHPRIGIVFQEPRLLPWLDVARNVGFPLAHLPPAERARRVTAALAQVGLSAKAGAWPKALSGGQAQRVAIARALVAEPEVLLLDEPFSALDAFTRLDLQDHLLALWSARTPRPTLVLVTHDVEEAVALADRVLVMRPHPGRIAHEVAIALPRPRDRRSRGFEEAERAVLAALDETRAAQVA